jgi:hypothetical protein
MYKKYCAGNNEQFVLQKYIPATNTVSINNHQLTFATAKIGFIINLLTETAFDSHICISFPSKNQTREMYKDPAIYGMLRDAGIAYIHYIVPQLEFETSMSIIQSIIPMNWQDIFATGKGESLYGKYNYLIDNSDELPEYLSGDDKTDIKRLVSAYDIPVKVREYSQNKALYKLWGCDLDDGLCRDYYPEDFFNYKSFPITVMLSEK